MSWLKQFFCCHKMSIIKVVCGTRWHNNRSVVVWYERCNICNKTKEHQKEFILENERDDLYLTILNKI